MTLRITGGTHRGRRVPSPKGSKARPTSSMVRQAIFNILGDRVSNARFLDLFAGSGIVGMEALSRGARELTAVESVRAFANTLSQCVEAFGWQAEIVNGDIRSEVSNLPERYFDIIYADPPYSGPLARSALHLVARHQLLADDGVLILEHEQSMTLPIDKVDLVQTDRREYGQTSLSFFGRSPAASDLQRDRMEDEGERRDQ